MDKQYAINLIRETFENSFKKKKFVLFVKELFNRISLETFEYFGQYIPDSFKPYISKYERIGKYQDSDNNRIDVLIVRLNKETSIERARTMQRNFVAGYLNGKYGSDKSKDAALVAFVSPNQEDWRFSLVKMEYKLTQTKTGRPKGKEEFTPAKRFSFLVGINEHSHTAQSRLYPLLKEDVNNPTLAQLEEAFDMETVTKEFFENYRDLFIRVKEAIEHITNKDSDIKKDFAIRKVDIVDFAKKLMGQIVFLYFLQKKGWFGVEKGKDWGTGSKRFLRDLFERKIITYKNFFNNVLEPLFYDALARDRSDIDHYNEHFKTKIPFLNGGLFDPINDYDWVNTDILLSDKLFSNDNITRQGDKGDGILDVFDRYNFTVREDEPLEKEVAIDPELLGKAYEKFNAIRSDNFIEYKKALRSGHKGAETKFNKQYGVYYTPREIVHYMCQQSLINYLVTETEGKINKEAIEFLILHGEKYIEYLKIAKEKKDEGKKSDRYKETEYFIEIKRYASEVDNWLANIKVCDPAIGSGAFPVGMMSEIIKARLFFLETKCVNEFYVNIEGDRVKRNAYNYKRDCIHNSLYGVDIDHGAVEIAKLRLWLSLVVDEEDIKTIKPLPNLDYRIMQGNSLLEEYEGIKLIDEKFFKKEYDKTGIIKRLEDKQKELQEEYYDLHKESQINRIEKVRLEKELNKIDGQIKKIKSPAKPDEEILNLFELSEAKKKADRLLYLQKHYFDTFYKSDKDKLKEEIEHLIWDLIKTSLKEQNKEDKIKEIVQFQETNTKPFFLWHLYFAEVFKEKNGFDVVIANPPYVKEYINRHAFNGLRESPYYKGKMDIWYFFACKGIDLLKKENGVLTFIAQNNWVTSYGASVMRNKVIQDTQITKLIDFSSYMIFEDSGIQTMIMIFKSDSKTDNYKFDYRKLEGKDLDFTDVLNLLNKNQNYNAKYLSPIIQKNRFIDKSLTFSDSEIEKVLNKLLNISNFKLKENEVANGIHHHHGSVNKDRQKILGDKFSVGDGIFVLSDKEKNSIPFTKKELELIKPSYTTKELGRYYANRENSEWVIYTDSKFKYTENIKPYQNIKKHLDNFKKVITSDNKPYGLHRARDEKFFKGEKIIAVRKCIEPTFAYTDFDCYVSATFYVIKSERLYMKYLTAILNSKLIAFWLKNKGKMQGNNYQIDKEPLLSLPLKNVPNSEQQPFIEVVDKILSITKENDYLKNSTKQAKVKEYERQIDQMVYKLHGLTEEEIKIVEGMSKK